MLAKELPLEENYFGIQFGSFLFVIINYQETRLGLILRSSLIQMNSLFQQVITLCKPDWGKTVIGVSLFLFISS